MSIMAFLQDLQDREREREREGEREREAEREREREMGKPTGAGVWSCICGLWLESYMCGLFVQLYQQQLYPFCKRDLR